MKNIQSKLKKAADQAASLEARGFVLLNPPRVMFDGTPADIERQYDYAKQAMGCGCKGGASGGTEVDPHLMRYLGSKDSIVKIPDKDENGNQLGTPGLGYVRYGRTDRLPLHIYRSTRQQPYTSTALRFLTDLVAGKGVQLMYETAEYANGRLQEVSIPFETAGAYIEGKIADIKEKIAEKENSHEQDETVSPDLVDARDLDGYLRSKGVAGPVEYRVAAPPPQTLPSESVSHEALGTLDWQLKRLYDDYDAWIDTMAELEKFRAATNLDQVYQSCMADDQHLDIYTLLMTLEQGRRGSWNPKITKIEYKPMTCVRLEQMDANLRVNYVYYSDKFMYDSGEIMPVNAHRDLVAYPRLEQTAVEMELSQYVAANQKTPVARRSLHWAVTCQAPCGFSRYYPQPAWWSIFSSLVFQYVSTLMYDRAVERQNATMWSKLIYINNNYLQQYYADAGATDVESKRQLRDKLIDSINDFLRNRQNNGKTCTLDSFIAPGTNTVIRSIEIVDVPTPGKSASKEDMETCANLIFWAFGVHTSMIASFGSNPSSGGTQQRELYLLKQIMMAARQRRFTDIIDSAFRFNKFDKHLHCRIGREVLSTLDASKTGIVEQQ